MEIDEQGRRIWDISQPLRLGIPVWPGDTPFDEQRTWVLDERCPVNVSRLVLSTHTGTHADAPWHYDPHGEAAAALPIAAYLGRTQVLSVIDHNGEVRPDQVRGRVASTERRLLLRTFATFPAAAWRSDFASLSPELIAIPLRLVTADASPVRAILRELPVTD